MILSLARPHRFTILIVMSMAAVSVMLDHWVPWLIKDIIDHLGGGSVPRRLWWQLLIIGALLLFSGWLGYRQRLAVAAMSRTIEQSLREKFFALLIQQPKTFFDRESPGDLIQRCVNDLEQVQELFGPAWLHLWRTALTLVISTAFIYVLSPDLALYSLLFFLVLALASLRLMTQIYRGHRHVQAAGSELNSSLREVLQGMETTRTQGIVRWQMQRIEKDSSHLRQAIIKVQAISGSIWPLITLVCGAGIGGILFHGIEIARNGEISSGAFAATILYLVRAQYPLVGLGIMTALAQKGLASLDRVSEVLHRMTPPQSPIAPAQSDPYFASLSVRNLHYHFPDGSAALHGISLELWPGKSVGIVGETGSGKSTLLKILCGILNAPAGTVWINGQDISCSELDLPWKSLFSYAPQENLLFSWTLRDNLAMGEPMTESTILEIIAAAGFDEDLQEMRDGLDATPGERGVLLSGGQRQRLGLARSLLHRRPILLLDDVLSAVDPAREQSIIQRLFTRMDPRQAVVFVTHRYAALEHFHEILVMDRGRIIERGTHDELLAMRGNYYRNWMIQRGGAA